MKKYILLLTITAFFLGACDTKEEYEQINSKVVEMAGEWYVAYYINGVPITGVSALITYNTADDDGTQIWIDDQEAFWHFKAKATVNETYLFGGIDTLLNAYYESKVIVKNGQVFLDASKQPSGALTDSIYFELQFDDDERAINDSVSVPDPYGTTYQCAGFRRTGFIEDEP